tara:strand:- start:98 stop:430 length:333 start_codon:yes stop_codon:yes gene_type:complete
MIFSSPYKAMWLVVLFDLPTDTKASRYAYTTFRTNLLKNGFDMIQYSVYSRYCNSADKADVHLRRIKLSIPDGGEVRIMSITDKQYAKMQIYRGKTRGAAERPPAQVEMF